VFCHSDNGVSAFAGFLVTGFVSLVGGSVTVATCFRRLRDFL